ncbi:U-box domain-containing protein 30-like [Salvia hispanica]|uniref:U-box domain-containing protein 30-like n=1 Tax=Salvia hispanica TaxID=49212 RepID=UPI0020093969|nr:U-box domain-containing protein 30-like [Salvia hispanica]
MPMFKEDGILGIEVRLDGCILDVDREVKDGIFSGIVAGNCNYVGGEKLDLKKMIEELNMVEVPSVFICPISLEPMKDPVTLCTGQTYEQSNILKWFSLGHYTCPTTMQELWDDTLTSNKTLLHLIHMWFSQKYVQMRKRSEDAYGRASELLGSLKTVKGQSRILALKELRGVVVRHCLGRKAVVEEGGVALLFSFLGPFTSYGVGCEVVSILVNLDLDCETKRELMQPAKMSSIVDLLNEGSVETKVNCVRLIETLMEESDFRAQIVSSHSLLAALMRLVRDKRHRFPGLRLLKLVCTSEKARVLTVSIGAIPQLVELIPALNPESVELALFVLDALSSVPEGRQALKDCSGTIPNVVKLLMRVSENCTEHALSILWCVCKVSPEECSPVAVEAGLAAKLLLVIQSGCSPALKQRASELLKLCSLNYSDTTFISKCKLTRTMR